MTQYYKKDDEGNFVEVRLDQEDINDAVKERINRVNAKYADYDDLKQKISDLEEKRREDESKLSALVSDKASLEEQIKVSKLDVMKVRIQHEYGLNDELSEFIYGDTEDEIRARAEKLANNTGRHDVSLEKVEKPEKTPTNSMNVAEGLFGKED